MNRLNLGRRTQIINCLVEGNSTSLVERQNLTMRMSIRRFTRLTNAFSRTVENHRAAVALHFAHYNFVRLHQTIRCTPAMAAGVSRTLWTMEELVDRATAAQQRSLRKRQIRTLPARTKRRTSRTGARLALAVLTTERKAA